MHSVALQNKSFIISVCALLFYHPTFERGQRQSVDVLFCITNIEDVEFSLQIHFLSSNMSNDSIAQLITNTKAFFFHLKRVVKVTNAQLKAHSFKQFTVCDTSMTDQIFDKAQQFFFLFLNSSTK